MRSAQRKLVKAFDGKVTELVRALNDEVVRLRLQSELTEARIDEVDATRSSFAKVSAQVDESLGTLSLIEKLWKDEDYIGLRRALRVLIKEVDIRPDGAVMILRPLRALSGLDITTGGKAAPVAQFRIPHELRRLRRRAA
jgi:hypothetical protein